MIGPEAPLVDGLADRLRADGRLVFGPGRRRGPARGVEGLHEGAARRGRRADGRATAPSTTSGEAAAFLRTPARPVRGQDRRPGRRQGRARRPTTLEEAEADVAAKLSGAAFGDAGRRVVIEEGLAGPEFSLLVALRRRAGPCRWPRPRTSSGSATATPGPTPAAWARTRRCPTVDDGVVDEVMDERGRADSSPPCAARGIDYRGVLYAGLMLTADGPEGARVQRPLRRPRGPGRPAPLAGDLVDAAWPRGGRRAACRTGRRRLSPTEARGVRRAGRRRATRPPRAPGDRDRRAGPTGSSATRSRGDRLPRRHRPPDADGPFVTAGGRVLGVTRVGADLAEARRRAYEAADRISWPGMHYRRDIAELAAGVELGAGGVAVIPRYSPPRWPRSSATRRAGHVARGRAAGGRGAGPRSASCRRRRRGRAGPGPRGRRGVRRRGRRARAGHRPRRGGLRRRRAGARSASPRGRGSTTGSPPPTSSTPPVRHPDRGRRPADRRRPTSWSARPAAPGASS